MKKTVSLFVLFLCACTCMAQYYVESPDGELRVDLQTNKGRKGASKFLVPQKMIMRVSCEGRRLVNNEIGLTVKSEGRRYAFGKSDIVHSNKTTRVDHPDTKDSLLADLTGRYNCLLLGTDTGMLLEVRAYNDGVAYRFRVTNYPEDYKILEVCDVFPGEKPIAILGTFEGTFQLPWRTMKVEKLPSEGRRSNVKTYTSSDAKGRGTRLVPWKDALSSVAVGISFDWFNGGVWGDVGETHSFRADFTYKYLYGGISLTACQGLLYIPYDMDFWPFERVIAGIDAWGGGVRAGVCLPVQNGYEVWSFIPYLATSMIHLHQHGQTRLSYKDVDKNNHWMMGPGFKVQLAHREGLTLGLGYEHQFFFHKKSPKGMNSVMVSMGKMF